MSIILRKAIADFVPGPSLQVATLPACLPGWCACTIAISNA